MEIKANKKHKQLQKHLFEPPKDWRQDLAEIATAEIFGNFRIFGIFRFFVFLELLDFLEFLEHFGILQFFTQKKSAVAISRDPVSSLPGAQVKKPIFS